MATANDNSHNCSHTRHRGRREYSVPQQLELAFPGQVPATQFVRFWHWLHTWSRCQICTSDWSHCQIRTEPNARSVQTRLPKIIAGTKVLRSMRSTWQHSTGQDARGIEQRLVPVRFGGRGPLGLRGEHRRGRVGGGFGRGSSSPRCWWPF